MSASNHSNIIDSSNSAILFVVSVSSQLYLFKKKTFHFILILLNSTKFFLRIVTPVGVQKFYSLYWLIHVTSSGHQNVGKERGINEIIIKNDNDSFTFPSYSPVYFQKNQILKFHGL